MIDGPIGTSGIAELNGMGRTDLDTSGDLTWQVYDLENTVAVTSPVATGIVKAAGTDDQYTVEFTRPSVIGNFAFRWHLVAEDITVDEQFQTFATLESYFDYRPTTAEVGVYIRARLKDSVGNELPDFTDDTRPTADQAEEAIDQAVKEVSALTDTDIAPEAYAYARQVIALRAAMFIELSYFPEQIPTGRSPYEQLRDIYEGPQGDGGVLARLLDAVHREQSEEELGDETGTPLEPFWFTDNLKLLGMGTRW